MTAIDNNPTTTNFLSPIHFDFSIKRSPNLTYYVQSIKLPGMFIGPADEPTPFVDLPYPGEHIEYETLDIVFAVDENMQNYLDLYNWKRALGKPDDFSQYAAVANQPIYTGKGPLSEIIVYIMNSARQPKFTYTFHDAWPNSLSGFDLDSRSTDVNYVKAAASFKFSSYDLEPIV